MTETITLSNGRQVRLARLPELKSLDLNKDQAPASSPGPVATPPDEELWARLEAMSLDDPTAPMPISKRLAQEHKWTAEQAQQAIAEYKRFLYLAVRAGHPVTPSRPVDLVWHEHLLHTRHYWDTLCKDVLRQTFHHAPGDGSTSDGERLQAQYRRTLDSYRTAFGDDPPTAIWPRPVVRTAAKSSGGGPLCFFGVLAGGTGIVSNAPVLMLLGVMMVVVGFIVLATQSNAASNSSTTTGGCGAGCGGGAIGSTGCADGSSGDTGSSSDGGGSSCGGGGCGGGGD